MINFSKNMENAITPVVIKNFSNVINNYLKEVSGGVLVLNETDYLKGINLRKDEQSLDLLSDQKTMKDGSELCLHISHDTHVARKTNQPLPCFISNQPTYTNSAWIIQRVIICVNLDPQARKLT